jgi:hypothetical protein
MTRAAAAAPEADAPEFEQRLPRGRPRRAQERILHEARRQRQGCREHDDLVIPRVDGVHPLSTPRGRPLVRAGKGGAPACPHLHAHLRSARSP